MYTVKVRVYMRRVRCKGPPHIKKGGPDFGGQSYTETLVPIKCVSDAKPNANS